MQRRVDVAVDDNVHIVGTTHLLAKPPRLLLVTAPAPPPPWRLPLTSLVDKAPSLQSSPLVPPQECGDMVRVRYAHCIMHRSTTRPQVMYHNTYAKLLVNEHPGNSEHKLERTPICQQPPAYVFHC